MSQQRRESHGWATRSALLIGLVSGLLTGLLAALPAAATVPAAAGGHGSLTAAWYPAQGVPGAREYWLYRPAGPARPGRPVVVFLHGCNETALQAAAATHFDRLADQRDFLVVYPQQTVTAGSSAPLADGNGIGCWNWFLPADQQRGLGEPATLAGLTRYVVRTQRADPDRVYVEGISAGADMAVVLGAAYPDVYAGVGVLAGCAYRTCSDVSGELAYHEMGPRAREVAMFVENGTADTLNPWPQAAALVSSWLGVDDLVDGAAPGSGLPIPASVNSYDVAQQPSPGSGDACIHNDSFPCPGGVLGLHSYPYTVARYDDAGGCEAVELWLIHGLEHAHPDAPGDGPYTDPLGPDVTTASYDFLAGHRLSYRQPRCR